MKKLQTIFLVLLLIFTAAESQAVSLGFTSTPVAVFEGETFSVDLAVSGLEDMALGGFDLNVRFDPTLLSFKNATYGDRLLGDQLASDDLEAFTLTTAGVDNVNLWAVSLEYPAILDFIQADSFVLATLSFQSLGQGTSRLEIFDEVLSDASANLLTADLITRSIEIQSQPVPEPASCLLVATGLAGFAGMRLRRKKG